MMPGCGGDMCFNQTHNLFPETKKNEQKEQKSNKTNQNENVLSIAYIFYVQCGSHIHAIKKKVK